MGLSFNSRTLIRDNLTTFSNESICDLSDIVSFCSNVSAWRDLVKSIVLVQRKVSESGVTVLEDSDFTTEFFVLFSGDIAPFPFSVVDCGG